jgi:hypothetical protein
MNEDANNNAASSDEQGKSPTYKRAGRQGRNRPVLDNSTEDIKASLTDAQADEAPSAGVATATTTSAASEPESSTVTKKWRPKFFSTIGKKEEAADEVKVDPAAARIARATRARPGEKKSTQEVSSPAAKNVTPAKSAPARAAAQPARRPGGFKPKHLIGILVYLLVADVAGVWEKSLLGANDRVLFTIGPLQVAISTMLFLLTLVVLLVVLARFDLVPRSLAPAGQQRPASRGSSQQTKTTSTTDTSTQPGMKQGVKGTDDDLYQEYRQNQRYWQRKDRKK